MEGLYSRQAPGKGLANGDQYQGVPFRSRAIWGERNSHVFAPHLMLAWLATWSRNRKEFPRNQEKTPKTDAPCRERPFQTRSRRDLTTHAAAQKLPLSACRLRGQHWDSIVWTTGAQHHYLYPGDKAILRPALQATKNSVAFFE